MDNDAQSPIADARILAAMKAVNPPLEKLMADRFALVTNFDRPGSNEIARNDGLRICGK